MKYYCFEDLETSETFVVGAESEQEATSIALENFSEPIYWNTVTEEWVDICGLDVY